ncbi:MAG: 50S ribosomal protein L11 methyltransferase [Lachnospiraceae bacterium]|uniref:Ribosomal protein L11 methyltransferase n=1 Tax=Candidatus Weimeria bifida TaxID=2599074 RepID=A0A6N7IYH9_9FIRM|nr:50S ribosomal protein L11 methyltransferase [Candidatus Weimeria bifida]RRF95029.1 MAG: 50S ribosomal protein L11 methyltransferase [Lachnospiraceae bacterium]
MRWTRFSIETTEKAEDIVSALLLDYDITNIEIEDRAAVTPLEGENYEELVPDRGRDDGKSRVIFYVEEGRDYSKLLEDIRFGLDNLRKTTDIGDGTIDISYTDEKDWRNKWKEYFHTFTVGKYTIVPSWEESDPKTDKKHILRMDPGITFGTGKHESTRMIIEELPRYIHGGEKVLDLGTGSGILSMTALREEASSVTATDIDPATEDAVAENFKRNDLDISKMNLVIGDLSKDSKVKEAVGSGYDVVCANILADIIIGMLPAIKDAIKPNGVLLTSGIIDFKQEQVKKALEENGFDVAEVNTCGEWVSIVAVFE